ncbi:MAG: hypothetical protein OEM91_05015 [Hyphomicrobiales bacterium]|nr:hypothetical protein [Hyphomicrobiales bacterium]
MHIVYYGTDGEKAKAVAAESRAQKQSAQVRHAKAFMGKQPEPADKITILPCVEPSHAAYIKSSYPDAEIVSTGRVVRRTVHAIEKPDKPVAEIDKTEPAVVVDPIEAARRDVIEIPEEWAGMPFMSKRALARNIVGNDDPRISADVDAAIGAELARRAS